MSTKVSAVSVPTPSSWRKREIGFSIVLLRDRLQLPLVIPDALRHRANRLKGRRQGLRYVRGGPLVEASGQALGQAGTEGLDRTSNVVYELRAATDQRLPGADDGLVSLGVFAPMLYGVE